MCTLEEVNTKLLSENEELHSAMMLLKKEYKVISFNSLVTLNTLLLAMLAKAIWNSCHYVCNNVLCRPSRMHRQKHQPNHLLHRLSACTTAASVSTASISLAQQLLAGAFSPQLQQKWMIPWCLPAF